MIPDLAKRLSFSQMALASRQDSRATLGKAKSSVIMVVFGVFLVHAFVLVMVRTGRRTRFPACSLAWSRLRLGDFVLAFVLLRMGVTFVVIVIHEAKRLIFVSDRFAALRQSVGRLGLLDVVVPFCVGVLHGLTLDLASLVKAGPEGGAVGDGEDRHSDRAKHVNLGIGNPRRSTFA